MLPNSVVFICVLTVFVFEKNAVFAKKAPASCVVPKTVNADLSKFSGVWYQQVLVRQQHKKIEDVCIRLEYTLINSTSSILTRTAFLNSRMTLKNLERNMVYPGYFYIESNSEPIIEYHKYALYVSDDAHVFTTCIYNHKDGQFSQYEEVRTRDQIVTKKEVKRLLKDAQVKTKTLAFVSQMQNCYSCKCK